MTVRAVSRYRDCGLSVMEWRLGKKAIQFVSALCILMLPVYYLMLDMRASPLYSMAPPLQMDQSVAGNVMPSGRRKFVIILPADQPSPDLCKVVSSAMALGYPVPVVVNWKQDFHTENDGIGPSQLGKISGTLGFLDWATSQKPEEDDSLAEDDLVMMLDAYDVWLQLPPSVLLDRYFKINAEANRRIRYDHNQKDNRLMNQSIIISAQKGCVAPRDSVTDLHCNDIPQSTLPPNVYGLLTDVHAFKWKYVRPRYVNSGSFIGPVGDMRRYFRRVKEKMDRYLSELGPGKELAGDQGVFAEVFGEQEVWRQQVQQQQQHSQWHARGSARNTETAVALQDEFEYHVGLDYIQELFYPTCYAESDGYFVALNNSEALHAESRRFGVSPTRISHVPSDIAEAEIRLMSIDGASKRTWSWRNLPLYTDFWTTTVPVALHHNAWRNGLKSRRVTWWNQTWYFPHLRDLLKLSIDTNKTAPIAKFAGSNASLEVWGYGHGRTKKTPVVFVTNETTLHSTVQGVDWATICKDGNSTKEFENHWYDEVFRDGKGALV